MIFYAQETWIRLGIVSVPAVISCYLFFQKDKKGAALLLLLLSALLLRLLMISLDPFVHEWDERYHALVAKNMITAPFQPMLHMFAVMAYDMHDWSNNHIWVHKQPLFLWQMAASMKLFGVHVIALRLPSAIMGTILVWLTYDLCKTWTRNERVAYASAFLTTFSFYSLELISGRMSLEHNDLAFLFYVTAAVWAWTRYVKTDFMLKWALLAGLFVGMAILNKWLTAMLVYGGWGLYVLLSNELRSDVKKYVHLLLAFVTTCVVFVPWQLYILQTYPAESAIAFGYNVRHMTEDLGHPGDIWFHLRFLTTSYHYLLLPLMGLGMITLFFHKNANRKMTISFMAMILVIFAFFSILVKTKMPALVYPVSPLLLCFMAFGIFTIIHTFSRLWTIPPIHQNILWIVLVFASAGLLLKPHLIAQYRSETNDFRNMKIHNSTVYKNIPEDVVRDRVIINCKSFENVELMFYRNTRAYHWYPEEHILDSLQHAGYKFAAFLHVPGQGLPTYITEDPDIVILEDPIR